MALVKFHPSMVETAVMIARQKMLAELAPDLAAQEAGQSTTVPAQAPMTTGASGPAPAASPTAGTPPTPVAPAQMMAVPGGA